MFLMTRWDIPPVSLGKSCAFVVGVLFGLWPRSFVLLRCFLSMAKRKSGGGICVSSFGFGAFCCACVIRFANFLMRPLCFMLSFSIRLLAYPNVRTEPQSDIGHNRGKKNHFQFPFIFTFISFVGTLKNPAAAGRVCGPSGEM